MTTDYSIVIPARYGSSRFPGKPLHKLAGRELLLHTVDRARESRAGEIVVATDDERIASLCEAAGVEVQMTAVEHPSGTDRIAEVATARKWPDDLLIVGLQGDEPMTEAEHLDRLADNLSAHPEAAMATLSVPLQHLDEYRNSHRVKVVRDHQGLALYFSRAPIPARRDDVEGELVPEGVLIHLGLYAYRRDFLCAFQALPPCELETIEQLEQLRVLHAGYRIHVGVVEGAEALGVDHPDDVQRVEARLVEKVG